MIPTTPRSDRLLLAVSFACFAIAGVTHVSTAGIVPTAGATILAVAGVYAAARYADRVTREALAHLSLAFWIAFLAIAGIHAIGLETAAGAVPGPTETLVLSLTAVTWGTLFSACSATVFLGFREYGVSTGVDVSDEVLDGDTSDYSTR
ncbi:hypothetical protein [Natrarchaeobius oligotrophus]|uniref:hypothetical protein n=1 Tax=Natrarchaeobius oligotrophus TaxID=3455743 RepID=UPI0037427107